MLTNWIANASSPSGSDEQLPVVDPATGQGFEEVPRGDPSDVEAAVAAASEAAPRWGGREPTERRTLLLEAADRLARARDSIARQLTRENGKPLAEARKEIDAAVQVTRSFAELVVHLRSGSQLSGTGELNFQYRRPRGVAAVVVPWNFPVAVALENLVPNLAVGNTVVLKPSEKTPLATRSVIETAFSHLPSGVCNVVLGDGPAAGQPLVSHPQVDLVTFVGSEETGRRIAELCGRDLRKCVVELGGKDAFLVHESADLDQTLDLALSAKYTASGQICTSPERFLVADNLFEPFVERLADRSRSLQVGAGLAEDSEMGPLIDEDQRQKVHEHVSLAVSDGATVRCGGEPLEGPGFFYPPTVLTDVPAETPVVNDETFGPVAPVAGFADWDRAIDLANRSRYGLSAIVCTRSAPHALRAIERLEAGMVKINHDRGKAPGATSEPFKASGLGHGYGIEFLRELTREKSVHWRA